MPENRRFLINRTARMVTHSLLVGCGGMGTAAVAHCRDLAAQELFDSDRVRLSNFTPLRFCALDSAPQRVLNQGEDHEIETIRIAADTKVLEDILTHEEHPKSGPSPVGILSHMPRRDYIRMTNTLPNPSMGNSTCPPLGAINFLATWADIRKKFMNLMEQWKKHTKPHPWGDSEFNKHNQIFIVASLYGGTGAGVHLHAAALLRDLLQDQTLQIPNTAIYAIFFLPDLERKADGAGRKKLRSNAYACLKELDHFLSGNPYELQLGDRTIIIHNKGPDYLFNRVFLVNDSNQEKVELNHQDAIQMVGELLFHWTCTSLGQSINARLIDDPKDRCLLMAPEGSEGSPFRERRICFYSTFGLATSRIPYEDLRHNLIVDCAQEILNELLLHPDHQEPEEIRKIQEHKKKLEDRFPPSWFLKELRMDESSLEEAYGPPRPDFQLGHRGHRAKIEEYMKEKEEFRSLEEILAHIRTELREKVLAPMLERPMAESDPRDLREELGILNERVQKEGGFTIDPFIGLKRHVATLKAQYDGIKLEDAPNKIERQLDRITRSLDRNRGKRFQGKKRLLADFNSFFAAIREDVERCMSYWTARRIIPRLEELEKALDVMIDEVHQDLRVLTKAANEVRHMRRKYSTSSLLLNAVPDAQMEEFIHEYPYPAGQRPEDIAEGLKRNGIPMKQEDGTATFVTIEDVPDQDPKRIAEAIYQVTEEVAAGFKEDEWKRSFIESGLYPGRDEAAPGSGVGTKGGYPKVDAFTRTKEDLNKHSSPYLEYHETTGFVPCRETFLIHPSLLQGTYDVEEERWVRTEPWPLGRDIAVPGDKGAPISRYSLTSLQMHHGFPLYSLNEFEDWHAAYRDYLRDTDRPLHKFRIHMKNPLISPSQGGTLSESQVREVFEWALQVSRTDFPIFFFHQGTPILNMLEEDLVRAFYFQLYEEKYVPLDEIMRLYGEEPAFQEHLFERVLTLYNRNSTKGLSPLDPYVEAGLDADEKTLKGLFDGLLKAGVQGDEYLRLRLTDGTGEVFVSPQGTSKPRLHELLMGCFLLTIGRPMLRGGLTEESIRDRLLRVPAFLEAFLNKCREACDFLETKGQSERDWPSALREP